MSKSRRPKEELLAEDGISFDDFATYMNARGVKAKREGDDERAKAGSSQQKEMGAGAPQAAAAAQAPQAAKTEGFSAPVMPKLDFSDLKEVLLQFGLLLAIFNPKTISWVHGSKVMTLTDEMGRLSMGGAIKMCVTTAVFSFIIKMLIKADCI